MSSIASSPKLNEKASSSEPAPSEKAHSKEKASSKKRGRQVAKLLDGVSFDELFSREPEDFDMLSQLTHMSAVATSGMSRTALFEGTAGLSYSTSKYFRQVHLVAQRLGYDYSQACELVSETVKNENVRNLLLHFSTALSAGEEESAFLLREAALQRETYGKEYGRKIESLQKWSDAYVALMVSATLVVVISMVSMMIYPFSPIAIFALAALMVCVTFVGGWLIFTVAPIEVKTHGLKHKSPEQQRAGKLAKVMFPAAAVAGIGAGFLFGLAASLCVVGLLIAPIGVASFMDDRRIDARDRDISAFVRALGGVMAAAGITTTDALGRLNRRSLGSLEPAVRRLHIRLKNGISPDLCWLRLAAESGSELVTRTVRIFWDGVRAGGDTKQVSELASDYALKIWLLRADRKLVSTTFSWVVLPLHAVLLAILMFITQVVIVFNQQITAIQGDSLSNSDLLNQAGVQSGLPMQFSAITFVPIFVATVALFITAANSFAPYAAVGGHRLKLCLFAAIMMVMSAGVMFAVPHLVQGLFHNIAGTGVGPETGATATPIAGAP
jgi:flagellar protein FlaJ